MKTNLDIINVSLDCKDFKTLNNVSLTIEDEKIVGLIGRNGAGKTSLLSLIASFRMPTNGTINIDEVEAFENEEKMEDVIFVYPTDYAEDNDTVSDKLDIVRQFKPHYDGEYAHELLKKFNLPKDKRINELSKGMQSALHVTIGLSDRKSVV